MTQRPRFGWLSGWVVVAVLLGTMAYAIAEEFTLSTLYPSPRGVYRTLRVGSAAVSGPGAQLHVVSVDNIPAFQVEASSGNTLLIVTSSGLVGIGTGSPTEDLDIDGQMRVRGGMPTTGLLPGMVLTAENNTGVVVWRDPTYAE